MSSATAPASTTKTTRAQQILDRNSRFIPGGMASVNRAIDPPIAFARADGAYMWDVDGKRYIDYHAGFAPYLLGHNDPDVNQAVIAAIGSGQSNYGAGPTEQEGDLAELFLQCVSTAEKVQFFNAGSEATSQAIRVARAYTGREHVVLMQGGYNGNTNVVAANLMNTPEQLGGQQVVGGEYPLLPLTAGIPAAEKGALHAVEFNDLDAVEAMVKKYPIAALITEPVLQNIGVVKPKPGYLEGLRKLADQYGFLLIFDEVKTGFRSALGGFQSICGVTPDLSTFGKAMANGYPIAAMAGKAEFMDLAVSADPARRVLVAGTYNAHPVPVAATLACLRKLADPAVNAYQRLETLTDRLTQGMKDIFARRQLTATVVNQGSAHVAYFMDEAPSNWWDLINGHDFDLDKKYRWELIGRGVFHFPTPTKQGSVSLAHSEADIDESLTSINEVVASLTAAT